MSSLNRDSRFNSEPCTVKKIVELFGKSHLLRISLIFFVLVLIKGFEGTRKLECWSGFLA